MYRINLLDNAVAAYESALDALRKILDGEGSYINYRSYVLNLHSALELFFKKMLLNKNEFMIFSFDGNNYSKVLEKYEKSKKANKTLFQYVTETKDAKLPNTVTFVDAYNRLAYFYNEEIFEYKFLENLSRLNEIRNNITHFEIEVPDEEFIILNECFLKCAEIYSEQAEWGYSIDPQVKAKILEKDISVRKLIIKDEYNRKILNCIQSDYTQGMDASDYLGLANVLIESCGFENSDREKIIKRLQIFYDIGFTESHNVFIDEHTDFECFNITESCQKMLDEFKS
ncbi:hypothetical protein [Leptolinea tardivitalis]|uniref:Uncharacterized protein n=1 Tax=Leptolinea tardivitalis TaxID=229920 RepID=A0A0P6WKP1_9CHLR|nr:hypothetical protein [Leptolinea tardivitalis]KPL70335.1 hypothetical protein ADM99_14345 [Leptolinea tardivitalis]GAP21898.1 hypothetical protein LTAR_02116 [Leptolinea tardivitalis]